MNGTIEKIDIGEKLFWEINDTELYPDSTRRPGIVLAPSVRTGYSTDAVGTAALGSSRFNFQSFRHPFSM